MILRYPIGWQITDATRTWKIPLHQPPVGLAAAPTQPIWEFLNPRLQMSLRLEDSGFPERGIYCLTIFYLARLLFLGLLAQESKVLAGLLLPGPVYISRFPASSALIFRYIKQKTNPGNSPVCHSLSLNSLSDRASSCHLSESFFDCFYIYPEFLVILRGIGRSTFIQNSQMP